MTTSNICKLAVDIIVGMTNGAIQALPFETTAAMAATALKKGWGVSMLKKHANKKCPACGGELVVFYQLGRRRRVGVKVAACKCGYRRHLLAPAVAKRVVAVGTLGWKVKYTPQGVLKKER
jgi:predicted RNA-binding Zn-ribbon protein involved in translation (DUF1610 family)